MDETTSNVAFAWLMNVRSVEGEVSREVLPRVVIRRCTKQELSRIITSLSGSVGSTYSDMLLSGAKGGLPFVVEYDDEDLYRRVTAAFNLSSVGPQVGLRLGAQTDKGVSYAVTTAQLASITQRFGSSYFVDVTEQDLLELAVVARHLHGHTRCPIDVIAYASKIGLLTSIPSDSLRFLGFFGLLESLLTHPPKPTDPYDSITRQVKKKLTLLNNRWQTKVSYEPFGGLEPEKVWGKMYEYRSQLAHGADDLADPMGRFKGGLEKLGDRRSAERLLCDAVKALGRFALEEGQLLVDLKNC